MTSLLISVAKLVPEQFMIDELTKALKEYELFKTEENRDKLHSIVVMYSTKIITKDESLEQTLSEFERSKQMFEMFKFQKQ